MPSYKLNDNKMFADVTDGVAIVINSETGIYYGMNEFGTQVYQNLADGISSEKIWEKLKLLGVSEDNFIAFLNVLTDKEILIVSSENNSEVNITDDAAKTDNYILELKEYNDAQELLLADPIHEVKQEEGWTPEKSSINQDKEDVARREAKMEI